MKQSRELYLITNAGKRVEMKETKEVDNDNSPPCPVPTKMFDEEMMKLFHGETK